MAACREGRKEQEVLLLLPALLFSTGTVVTSPGFRWRRRRRRSQCNGASRARARERLPGQRPSARHAAVGAPVAAAAMPAEKGIPSAARRERKRILLLSRRRKAEPARPVCSRLGTVGERRKGGRRVRRIELERTFLLLLRLRGPSSKEGCCKQGRPHQRPANGSGPTACV